MNHNRRVSVSTLLLTSCWCAQAAWADSPSWPRSALSLGMRDPGESVTVQDTGAGLSLTSRIPAAAVNLAETGEYAKRSPDAWRTDSINQRMLTLSQEHADDGSGGSDANELAKKLSNPVANLISVPLQYNADFNAGATGKAHISRLNIQPVIPLSLNDHWNLIVRTILPVVYQEQLASGQGTNWGLGDTTTSLFFSPKQEIGGWILGAGPILLLPTGTDTALTGGKWGAGPTVLALRQEHGWTYGILASHTWSFAGDGDRGYVNSTFLQPFLSYQFPSATTVGLNTESIYDWRARQWTVPVNLFVSQVVKMGGHPVSFTLGGRFYTEGPSGGPDWGMRFVITLLFPK